MKRKSRLSKSRAPGSKVNRNRKKETSRQNRTRRTVIAKGFRGESQVHRYFLTEKQGNKIRAAIMFGTLLGETAK